MRTTVTLAILFSSVIACSGGSSSNVTGDGTGGGADAGPNGGDTDAGAGTAADGGASPVDAGGNADGGSKAGGDAGSAVSCAGLAFCEDFESYSGTVKNAGTLGPWKTAIGGAAVATVDTVKPYSGGKSLHITVPAGAAASATLTQMAAGGLIPNNDIFGRAMIYYSTAGGNDLPIGVHSWIFNASGNSVASGGAVAMNVANGGTQYFLNYHPAAPATEQSATGGKPVGGKWLCTQWQYDGSGAAPKNEGKIWIDGALVVDALPAKGWNFAVPWSAFEFGFTHYQTTTKPIDMYLDDFALNGSMIPCPP